jgi:hypothetical protein
MERVLRVIDQNVASLNDCADAWDKQASNPMASLMSAVHRFAAVTLSDVKKQIIEVGVTQ